MNKIDYKMRYDLWFKSIQDKTIKEKIENMSEEEKQESFASELEFGTAGVRGLIGIGSNKMNIYTVGKITLGLVKYLKNKYMDQEKIKVALATDPRRMHREFTKRIIQILGSNGIEVITFDDIKPTPMLSYLTRKYKCQAGIMITASHNPKEYNGYKVYNEDGAQLNLEEADAMIKYVNMINEIFNDNYLSIEEIQKKNLVTFVDEKFDLVYFQDIEDLLLDKNKKDIKIVFTPECGTAYKILPKAFKYFGFQNIIEVKEQMIPDGEFAATESANPEEDKAYALAISYAQKNSGDIIIANDPDADRLGVIAKNRKGEYIPFTGNQTGVLLIDYLLKRDNIKSGTIYKTIVTGELGAIIAKSKGIKVEETLTGFKFIAEKIKNNQNNDFIFGYEESYGYLIKACVRDKDAIQASLLISEMADYYLKNEIFLDEVLNELYNEYGYRYEKTNSITLSGIEGLQKIQKVMNYYRQNEIKNFDNVNIEKKIDFLEKQNDLPKADVIKFYLSEEQGWVVFRPSGTEPKLKIYLSISSQSQEKAQTLANKIYTNILKSVEEIK